MNKTLLIVIALTGMALSAYAQNLVINPGFETGDFTGYTQSGNTGFTSVSTAMPHSGSYSLDAGPTSSDGFLSQDIATVIGQSYTVSFFLANTDSTGGPDDFSASFGGVTGYSITDSGPFDYTQISFDALATSATSTLQFGFMNGPAYWFLDDISVTAAVPEPNTLALLSVIGAGALCLCVWRKRKAA